MTELEKIEEAARWQENYNKQLKDIKKLQKACHKRFMRWREAKKDTLYFDSSLQKQIEATLNLQKELETLRQSIKDYGAGCYENGLRNGKRAANKGKVVEHSEAYGQCRDSKRIAELEQKLEQTEKDLADYQFNYPTIKELQKENAELKAEIENDRDLPAIAYMQGAEKQKKKDEEQLAKAKEIIREFMKYEINEYDGSLEIHFEELKKQAEQFLNEVEK